MNNLKIVCASCKTYGPFTVSDLKAHTGEIVKGMVGVDLAGDYVCRDCMQFALENDHSLVRPIPVQQYIMLQQVKSMSGLITAADDLLLQSLTTHGDTVEYAQAVQEWRTNFEKFKNQAKEEPENEH